MIEEQTVKKTKELYVRMFSVAVCDLFDELLDEHDITIPSQDREGEDSEARIYGDVYYDLEAKVTEVLARLCEEVKAAPDVAINVEDYNGFEDNSPALPENLKITASTLAADTDSLYEDKVWLIDTISEYLSDTYGYCPSGFSFEVIYNEFNEPSETMVTDIKWDVDTSLKETSEEIFEKHVLAQLTEKGFDVSQIELEIIDFIDNDHKDCSWYGGAVAEVKYKDHLFSLEARGDINCTLFDKNENELGYVKDRNNAGRFCSEMAHCLANDTELHKAKEDGRLVFENNNWFEIFVRTPDEQWQLMTWLSSTDDIEECVLEMIETMDEMIEELDKSKQAKNSTDKSLKNVMADAVTRSADNSTNKTINAEPTIEK